MSKTCFPANSIRGSKKSCCSRGYEGPSDKKILVEYLFLDLQTCERCVGTDILLDEVMVTLTPALQLAGYEVAYHKVKMETADIAKRYQFLSSPTIRVNGRDVFLFVKENSCGCCSDISGTDVDCRVFEYNGKNYEVPPVEMLADAVLRAVFAPREEACSCGSKYELPDNLKTFFEGKRNKSSCGSRGSCCE